MDYSKDMQVADKHMKPIPLAIREIQIKTTMRYHFIPIRMAKIKQTITSVGQDGEKLEPSYTAGRNVKWCSCCGKQHGNYSKN